MPSTVDITTAGAVGDGATDCTTAIQSVLDAGNIAYVPAGVFRVGQLFVTRDGSGITGLWPSVSVLKALDNFTLSMVNIPFASLPGSPAHLVIDGVTIRRVTFDGNLNPWDGTGSDFRPIFANQTSNLLVEECVFKDWHGDGSSFAEGYVPNTNLTVRKCRVENCGRQGFHGGFGDGMTFDNNLVTNTPSAYWGGPGTGFDFEVEGRNDPGETVGGVTNYYPYIKNLTVTNNILERTATATGGAGVALGPAYGYLDTVTLTGNLIRNHQNRLQTTDSGVDWAPHPGVANVTALGNWFCVDNSDVEGYGVSSGGATNFLFRGNVVRGGNGDPYGLLIQNASHWTADSNTFVVPNSVAWVDLYNAPGTSGATCDTVALTNNLWWSTGSGFTFSLVDAGVTNETESGNVRLASGAAVISSTPPTVSLSLVGGATLSVPTTVTVSATDNGVGTAAVWWFVDGLPQGRLAAAPFTFTLEPSDYPAGSHAVSARSVDNAANPSDEVSVTVNLGSDPPAAAAGYLAFRSAGGGYMALATGSVSSPVADPVLSPGSETFSGSVDVSATTATPGASVRWTSGFTPPTSTTGTFYTGPVRLTATTSLNFIAYKSGFPDSRVVTGTYTMGVPTAATPVFSPAPEAFSGSVDVTVSTTDTGVTINYTTDGSTPSPTHGTAYTALLHLTTTTPLKAVAFGTGFIPSPVRSGTYTLSTGGFTPADVTSVPVAAWFARGAGLYQDTGATLAATDDGHPVRVWKDQVNGHVVRVVGSNAPTLKAATTPDDGPAVDFDRLLANTLAGAYPVGTTFTRYVSYWWRDPVPYNAVCDGYTSSSAYLDIRGARFTNGSPNALLGNSIDGYWHTLRLSVGGGTVSLAVDGDTTDTNFYASASCPSPVDPGGLTLALWPFADARPGSVRVREVVDLAGTPSTPDDANLMAYMRQGLEPLGVPPYRVEVDLGDSTGFHQHLQVDGPGNVTLLGHINNNGPAATTQPVYTVKCGPNGESPTFAVSSASFNTSYSAAAVDAAPSDTMFLNVGSAAGKFLQVGFHFNSATDQQFKACRFNPDLTIDTSFGTSGFYTLPHPVSPGDGKPVDWPYRCMEEPVTGKIYIGGACRTGSDTNGNDTADAAVIRLNPDGTLDTTWNASGPVPGVALLNVTGGYDQVNGMRIDPNTGKLVVSGLWNMLALGGQPIYGAARFDTDGTPDTGFGTGGSVTGVPGQDYKDFSRVFQIDSSSRVYFNWAPSIGSAQGVPQISRYTSAGVLDTSWGGTGTVLVPAGWLDDMFWGQAILPDGTLIAAGFMARLSAGNLFGLNGNYCSTVCHFDVSGNIIDFKVYDFGTIVDFVMFDVLPRPDGKILIAGYTGVDLYATHKPAIYRLNADLTIDTSFGG